MIHFSPVRFFLFSPVKIYTKGDPTIVTLRVLFIKTRMTAPVEKNWQLHFPDISQVKKAFIINA